LVAATISTHVAKEIRTRARAFQELAGHQELTTTQRYIT
jgi:hypothetical protein